MRFIMLADVERFAYGDSTHPVFQEDGMNQIDFKGSFIEVGFDSESLGVESALGFVIGGRPVEL